MAASTTALVREGVLIAWARKATFALLALVVAVGVLIPLFISSNAQQARDDALRALENPQLRSIVVTDPNWIDGGRLDRGVIQQIRSTSIVEELTALGSVRDLRPAPGWPQSVRIPTVQVLTLPGHERDTACGGVLLASGSPDAQRVPTLHEATELSYLGVRGQRETEPEDLQPDADLATQTTCEWSTARQLLIRLTSAAAVEDFARLAPRLAGAEIEVQFPEDLESLRREVSVGLSDLDRRLRVVSVLGAGVLIGAIAFLATSTQTRHYARRRALGARRAEVVTLILAQVLASFAVGLLVATFAAGTATVLGVPIELADGLAVATIVLITGIGSSLIVAIVASRRDPARVLRVP